MMIALPFILKEAFVTAGGDNTLIPQFNDRYSADSVARMFYRDLPSLPLIIPEGSNCTKIFNPPTTLYSFGDFYRRRQERRIAFEIPKPSGPIKTEMETALRNRMDFPRTGDNGAKFT